MRLWLDKHIELLCLIYMQNTFILNCASHIHKHTHKRVNVQDSVTLMQPTHFVHYLDGAADEASAKQYINTFKNTFPFIRTFAFIINKQLQILLLFPSGGFVLF